MSEFPPRYPSVPTLTTNRTPVGNTDANQKPMLINDFSTNEPPLSWMMFEQANLKKQLVELNNQLAEAKAEIERLQKNFTHAATIAKTAWLTESCGTTGDAEYGSELCQIISDKISALQQKEKE